MMMPAQKPFHSAVKGVPTFRRYAPVAAWPGVGANSESALAA